MTITVSFLGNTFYSIYYLLICDITSPVISCSSSRLVPDVIWVRHSRVSLVFCVWYISLSRCCLENFMALGCVSLRTINGQISAYSSHAVVRDSFLSQKAGRWKKSKPIRALNCSQNICVRFLQLYTSWIKPLCFGTYSRNYLYKPLTYPFPCCNFISRALISTRACGKTLRSQRNGFKDKKCTSSKRFDLKNVHDLRTQWLSEQNYKQVLNLVYRAFD